MVLLPIVSRLKPEETGSKSEKAAILSKKKKNAHVHSIRVLFDAVEAYCEHVFLCNSLPLATSSTGRRILYGALGGSESISSTPSWRTDGRR
jgi:hypothetical protein